MRLSINVATLLTLLLHFAPASVLLAQGGDVFTAASATYNPQLDPNGDGFITADGLPFPDGTTEAANFELPTWAVGSWNSIFDIDEAQSDITPSCGSTDIVGDADGGDIGYWIMTDPTPGAPRSGDEHLVTRMRLADRGTGNFGFNFLLSTDGLYGAAEDPNPVPGNQGFEYEIQFASGGGSKGVSGWNIDGTADQPAVLGCDQCIAIGDVQKANAAVAGGCTGGDPTFITLAYELSLLPAHLQSDVEPIDLFIALASSSSGNQTSILGGGNVKDFGGFDDSALPPDCASLTGAARFDCLIEDMHETQQAALPVTLLSFEVSQAGQRSPQLEWRVAQEINLAGYTVERSADGNRFATIGYVEARANGKPGTTTYLYDDPDASNTAVQYYRLIRTDFDGSFEYSPIVALNATGITATSLAISPNPGRASGQLQVDHAELGILSENGAYLVLADFQGRTLLRQAAHGERSVLSLSSVSAGLYTLSLIHGDAVSTQKVLVH